MMERYNRTPIDGASAPTLSDLFERYSANTDGKEKIASYVNSLGRDNPGALIIDLGAGDGRLTRYLLEGFNDVIAVERHPSFIPALAALPGVTPIASSIEDFNPTRPFDIGLLSYSLSGIPKDRLQDTLDRLLLARKDGGRLLFVTYRDGCEWDQFADEVAAHLNLPRTGGLARHTKELNDLGFHTEIISTLNTRIWSENSRSLYENLGFFFHKKISEYINSADQLQPALERLQSWDGRQMNLSVEESIVEIIPRR